MSTQILAQPRSLNNPQPQTTQYPQDARFWPTPEAMNDAELFLAYESAALADNFEDAALYIDALIKRVEARQ